MDLKKSSQKTKIRHLKFLYTFKILDPKYMSRRLYGKTAR